MELFRTQDTKPMGFFPPDALANSFGEFYYNPEEGIMFAAYFYRYDNVFSKECTGWIEEKKITLFKKSWPKLGKVSFDETVQILMNIFGKKFSI